MKFAFSIRDQLNLYEPYPDDKLYQMDGPSIKRFIEEYKDQLPRR